MNPRHITRALTVLAACTACFAPTPAAADRDEVLLAEIERVWAAREGRLATGGMTFRRVETAPNLLKAEYEASYGDEPAEKRAAHAAAAAAVDDEYALFAVRFDGPVVRSNHVAFRRQPGGPDRVLATHIAGFDGRDEATRFSRFGPGDTSAMLESDPGEMLRHQEFLPVLWHFRPLWPHVPNLRLADVTRTTGRVTVDGVSAVGLVREKSAGSAITRFVDPARDYVVVRRELSEGGRPVAVHSVRYRRGPDGLTVPAEWDYRVFDPRGAVELAHTCEATLFTRDPSEIALQPLPNELPVGTRVRDRRGGRDREFSVETRGTRWHSWFPPILLGLCLAALSGALIVYRCRRVA